MVSGEFSPVNVAGVGCSNLLKIAVARGRNRNGRWENGILTALLRCKRIPISSGADEFGWVERTNLVNFYKSYSRWWFQISNIFYFHPENWGRIPILDYFSIGLGKKNTNYTSWIARMPGCG